MDPVSLGMVMKALEPMLGILALAVIPIGIIWLRSSHKIRMRELDVEEKMVPNRFEARLALIEARLAAIEDAVGAPARNVVHERAALLEGPATSETVEAPPPMVRGRER
jgi:hypothetical protein